MGISLPRDEDISIVAIEAENVYDFSEALTPPIEAAVPLAAQTVLNVIKTWQQMTPKPDHHS
jgi:Ni,Fe-hydrogenase maturation factor